MHWRTKQKIEAWVIGIGFILFLAFMVLFIYAGVHNYRECREKYPNDEMQRYFCNRNSGEMR